MDFRGFAACLRDTVQGYTRHGNTLLGAGIAFYALLSAAPLALIAVAIAGFVFGEDLAHGQLRWQLRTWIGPKGADVVTTMMEQAREPLSGGIAAVVGVAVILFAASRLFNHLHSALNHVMGVRARVDISIKTVALKVVQKRLLTFGLVILCGLVLMLLLLARLLISTVTEALEDLVQVPRLWKALDLGVSFAVVATMFAVIFKYLPDVRVKWKDVWLGSVVTTVLLGIGTMAIGWFMGTVGTASTYGAAGAAIVVLLWVYYSAQIFFFGAEFMREWARRFGGGVRPQPWAVRVVDAPADEATAEE
ncbi:MAG: YihY/virulence factor BrkB family protein [Polyangiales bacterium]